MGYKLKKGGPGQENAWLCNNSCWYEVTSFIRKLTNCVRAQNLRGAWNCIAVKLWTMVQFQNSFWNLALISTERNCTYTYVDRTESTCGLNDVCHWKTFVIRTMRRTIWWKNGHNNFVSLKNLLYCNWIILETIIDRLQQQRMLIKMSSIFPCVIKLILRAQCWEDKAV